MGAKKVFVNVLRKKNNITPFMFINPLDTDGKICKELRGKGRHFQLGDFFFSCIWKGRMVRSSRWMKSIE